MPRPQRTKREPAESPAAPSIDLRGTTSAAAYERILESLAVGRITIPEALKLGNLVEIGISVRDAEVFRAKLASLEASQKAQLRSLPPSPPPPARRQTLEVFPPSPPAGEAPPAAPWGAA